MSDSEASSTSSKATDTADVDAEVLKFVAELPEEQQQEDGDDPVSGFESTTKFFSVSDKDSDNGDDADMRHTLTKWERESVIRLKDACEKEGIAYNHIFELAKYVLVVKSMYKDDDPEADKKRLKKALERMRDKRKWEEKKGVNKFFATKQEALREFEQAEPHYHHAKYVRDTENRRCVTFHAAYPPTNYITKSKDNTAKFLMLGQWAMDIAAYDMVEARRGISAIGIVEDKMTLGSVVKTLRFLMTEKENVQPIHNHRIAKIYIQTPSIFATGIKAAIKLLPKKLTKRVTVVSDLQDLESHYIQEKFCETVDTETVFRWYEDCDARYQETLQKLQL